VTQSFADVVAAARACDICKAHLPLGPRPVFQIDPRAKLLVVGQAPGIRVHETGIPFNDPSGDRLRHWMGVTRETFYDATKIAILPMAYCYPGTGKSGDLPPRAECAPKWRNAMLALIPDIEFTLVIGRYAQDWHLGDAQESTLTATVQKWMSYWPSKLVLPHPSPRNNIWLKKNEWFEGEILPVLKTRIAKLLMP
jgi:uracil-DNA glycosylase